MNPTSAGEAISPAAATISLASTRESASGFSHSTDRPARSADSEWSRCVKLGEATTTASASSSSASTSVTGVPP
ncbi:Uncharacterised protein [Mycobacteroides abscessus subsp. abscessus]|nr:Uncharacterised protein [Mycobacteroides abscessus subsp. abscessus]